ncbi:MAG: hypothetical protein Salg2KO_07230 [Salibacteraceae bacterium]
MADHITLNFLATTSSVPKVEVSVSGPHDRYKEKIILKVIEAEEVYKQIEAGNSLDLVSKYVKDFSISRYRSSRGLDADATVELKDFNAKGAFFDIEEGVDFDHARFIGSTVSFESCFFGDGPVSFYHAEFAADQVSFEKSHFGAGKVNFHYAAFMSNSVSFDGVEFQSGDVEFISSKFADCRVTFKEALFGEGNADFHYTTFGDGSISFDKAVFGGGLVSFKRVDFGNGKVDFKRVDFGDGYIDFSEAEFKSGKVVFRSAIFGDGDVAFNDLVSESDFIFDNAEFGSGKLVFFGATARKLSFQLCQFNSYVDLRVEQVQKIDLSHTIVRDIVDMMPTERCSVTVQSMEFKGMRNLGNLYIDWRANHVLRLILNQPESTLKQKSEQFLILKESYNATGRYADEDKAYIWYKRYELKADLEHALEKDPKNAIWAYPVTFSKWLIFDKIGLYATEPVRVLFSVGVVYSIFSLLYLILPYVADTYIDTGGGDVLAGMNEVAKAFYYSAITFLTIGYGEFYPVGVMRIFASIEGYVGVFLMGYFSVAFVRKVLR